VTSDNNHLLSGIRDNHKRGKVGDFLRKTIDPDAKLSFVSAYFTIYAYEAMREKLDSVDSVRFLFGEPRFVSNLDPDKTDKKAFNIEDSALQLANQQEQRRTAADITTLESQVDALVATLYGVENVT